MNQILCYECRESDPNETSGCYKIYCSWYREYVDRNDTCTHAIRRGYYVSTAICNVLGISNESEVPSTIKNYSINYLQKSKETFKIVREYDNIGPVIASYISKDNDKELCQTIYSNYLKNISLLIKRGEYIKVTELYKNMLNSLIGYYSIDDLENEYDKKMIKSI